MINTNYSLNSQVYYKNRINNLQKTTFTGTKFLKREHINQEKWRVIDNYFAEPLANGCFSGIIGILISVIANIESPAPLIVAGFATGSILTLVSKLKKLK
jgi:hypothetical protein